MLEKMKNTMFKLFVIFAFCFGLFNVVSHSAHATSTNLALGKSYTSSTSPSGSYPDTGNSELTNGNYAIGDYTDAAWQGRLNVGSYNQTVDIGQIGSVSEMFTNFLQQSGVGIYWPDTVSFSYSTDGVSFTGLGNAIPQTAVGNAKKYKILLGTAVNARYIRMTVTDASAWVFEDEMEVLGVAGSGSPIIQGSIIQPVYAHSWTESDWEAEFATMKNVGMDHLILQWTIQKDALTKEVYYTSALYNSGTGYYVPNNHDTLNDLLTAAQVKGIDVWVGIDWSDDWWTKASTDPTWLADEATFAKNVINDIWNSGNGYKNKSSFKGWYIPWEIDNVNFTSAAQQLNLRNALKTIVDYAKTNTNKPIMISPFFNDSMGQTTSEWTAMWTYFLNSTTGANIDIVALQDGIGVHHALVSTIGNWLSATKAATDTNAGSQLWANIETFNDVGNDTYMPAPMSRIVSQIDAESSYVKKLTSYSFNSYQSPQVVGLEQYDDWKRLIYPRIGKIYTGPANGIENKALGKSYTASVSADTAYPDTNSTELTDGVFASGLWQGEPAFQGRINKTSYNFEVDLSANTLITNLYLDFLKSASNNVFFPSSVQFLTSTDNVTFTSRGTVSQLSDPLDSVSGNYQVTLGTAVNARYVKAIVTTGTAQWTMCDEFGVVGNR